MEMKLELVPIPVSDVDRAKAFYEEKVGFHADIDSRISDETRFVQCTPPGSNCSIAFGEGVNKQKPGTVEGLTLVVKDIQEAYKDLRKRGLDISEPAVQPWGSIHSFFSDPDGNGWTLQQPVRRDA